MSTVVMSACWPLSMPPTPKAVLISLADNANDHGECWPSIPTIATRTCFSERAVQNAIKWLEDAGVVTADRSNGRHTRYTLTPAGYAPAQHMRHAAGAVKPPQQVRQPPQEIPKPPQQVPSNRKEPSRTVKATARVCPDDVDPQVWEDWLALRDKKRAPVTGTVIKSARSEAGKAGLSLTAFLEIWCARGSQGLQADWLKPSEYGKPAAPAPVQHKTVKEALAPTEDKLTAQLRWLRNQVERGVMTESEFNAEAEKARERMG